MRLIDADVLAKFIDYGHLNNPNEKLYSENDIREIIDMMPTVDAIPIEWIKEWVNNYCDRNQEKLIEILLMTWNKTKMPTVDAVEVVRCKDYRWGKEACGSIECFADLNAPTEYHGYEWYCPNGERRFENEIS